MKHLAKLAVQTENEWFSRMARRVLMETAWVTMDTGNFPYAYNSPHEVMRAWSVRLGHPDQNIGARQNLAVTDKSPLVRRELASSLPAPPHDQRS
jgi:hypothetical protein